MLIPSLPNDAATGADQASAVATILLAGQEFAALVFPVDVRAGCPARPVRMAR